MRPVALLLLLWEAELVVMGEGVPMLVRTSGSDDAGDANKEKKEMVRDSLIPLGIDVVVSCAPLKASSSRCVLFSYIIIGNGDVEEYHIRSPL